MANFKNFNAKFLEEKLKRNWTTSDFSEYFQCAENEFIAHMQKSLSPHAFRGFSARLKRNEKHRPVSRNETPVVTVDNSSKDAEVIDGKKIEETTPSSTETLEGLEAQREAIKAILNEMELKHKALCSDRLEIQKTLTEYRERLVKLEEQIRLCKIDVASLVEELDIKLASMQELNISISSKRTELQEIETKIDALQSVVIFVYSTGNIDIEAPFTIEIPEWKNKLNDLIACDDAGSLTLNQLKTLAKVLALTQFLDSQNWKYDVAFDNDEMETFYLKIKS